MYLNLLMMIIRKLMRKKTDPMVIMAEKVYKERVKQVNFIQGYQYDGELMPFVSFYKFLAKRNLSSLGNKFEMLQMFIPDTIVYND